MTSWASCYFPIASDMAVAILSAAISSIEKFKLKASIIKNIGHIMREIPNDVSNFLLFNFVRFDFYKARIKPCKSQKAL